MPTYLPPRQVLQGGPNGWQQDGAALALGMAIGQDNMKAVYNYLARVQQTFPDTVNTQLEALGMAFYIRPDGSMGMYVPPEGGGTGTTVRFDSGAIVFAGVDGSYQQDIGLHWDVATAQLRATNIAIANAATVGGPLSVTGGIALSGGLTVAGPTTLQSTLHTVGDTTLDAQLSVAGATSVGSTLTVATSLSTPVAAITSTLTAATLHATGAATLDSSLNVAGATTLSSTLHTVGAATLDTTLGVTGPTTLSNTLHTVGNATFDGTLNVAGTSTLATTTTGGLTCTTLHATGATTLDSTLSAGGTTVSTFHATGGATLDGTLGVSGTTTLGTVNAGTVSTGALTSTTLHATGAATLDSTLGVTGTATLGTVNAGTVGTGALTCTTLHATGAATLDSTLGVAGQTTAHGATFAGQVRIWDAGAGTASSAQASIQSTSSTSSLELRNASSGGAGVTGFVQVNGTALALINQMGGPVAIATNPSAGSNTERFYISADGRLRGALDRNGSARYGLGGLAYAIGTAVSNAAGGGETTLLSWTMPANTLSANGDSLRVIYGVGLFNVESKTLRMYCGGLLWSLPLNDHGVNGQLWCELTRTSATTIMATMAIITQTPITGVQIANLGVSDLSSTAQTVSLTGAGVTAGDVVGYHMKVVYQPIPV